MWQVKTSPSNEKHITIPCNSYNKEINRKLAGHLWILETTYTNLGVLLNLLSDLKSISLSVAHRRKKSLPIQAAVQVPLPFDHNDPLIAMKLKVSTNRSMP